MIDGTQVRQWLTDGGFVASQIRDWLSSEGFVGLVGHLRQLVEDTRQKLLDAGVSPDVVDDEVTAQLFAIALGLSEGMSITAAANRLAVDGDTIRRWLQEGGLTELIHQLRLLIEEVTTNMFQVALGLAEGQSITAASDQTKIDAETIRSWLNENGFLQLLADLKRVIAELKDKFSKAGLQPGMIDDEVTETMFEWALIAGLATPRTPPPAASAPHHPWLRLLKEGI